MEIVSCPAFPTFEWDAAKAEANVEKHGIDFLRAAECLKRPHVKLQSNRDGEARTLAICPDTQRIIAVVYTMRGEACRIISARAARQNEQRTYRQIFG